MGVSNFWASTIPVTWNMSSNWKNQPDIVNIVFQPACMIFSVTIFPPKQSAGNWSLWIWLKKAGTKVQNL